MGKHNIITLFLTSFDRVEKELILHAWNILSPSYSLEFIYWKKKLILTILPLSIIVVLKVSLYHMIINIQGCRSLNFFLSFSISNLLTKLTLTILVNNRRKKKVRISLWASWNGWGLRIKLYTKKELKYRAKLYQGQITLPNR